MSNHERDERGKDWGDDGELGPLLDAYAAARLRSDPERTGIARARVMAEARRQLDPRGRGAEQPEGAALPTAAAGAPGPRGGAATDGSRERWRLPWIRPLRGSFAAVAFLVVALAVAGGVAAGSGPGGPFYEPRLWFEDLTLPSDPVAREAAQLAHLEARLDEAREAAASGNGPAVTAALDAYQRTADAAMEAAGSDLSRREHVAAALGKHVAVLRALVSSVPARASDAIRQAVERTEIRIEQILATPPPNPGKPEATPKPTKSPKPEATPKPTKSPRPTKSPPPNRPTPAP